MARELKFTLSTSSFRKTLAGLTLFFAVLKLSGVISWSWLTVFSPLWGGATLLWLILLIGFLVAITLGVTDTGD